MSEGNDSRTVEELVDVALATDNESDEYWSTITAIRDRGTKEVFDAAVSLCKSKDPASRAVGVDILWLFNVVDETFLDDSIELLLDVLRAENDPEVLYSLTVAFDFFPDERAIEPLSELSKHPDEDVRYGAAQALGQYMDYRAIKALIDLSGDENADVRCEATLSLSSNKKLDSSEIRDALYKRLFDDDRDVHLDALEGLAARKDERAIQPLIGELTGRIVPYEAMEGAIAFGDPRLLPALLQLRDKQTDISPAQLDEALESCTPKD